MIDYESLLEFEESLGTSCERENDLTLHNLELKIEFNRIIEDDSESIEFTEQELEDAFEQYDIAKDEFSTCPKCGSALEVEEEYKDCCYQFSEKRRLNTLEKSYWLSFINNPTRTINTLPNYTELLFLQQGVPHQIRSMIWKRLFLMNNANVPEMSRLVLRNFQHSYNSEISQQISKDLKRTFPTINFFKQENTIASLSTILNVYANYDVELGYCQGLLFLVGVLFYQFKSDSDLTFHALVNIMETEHELHEVFIPSTMSITLEKWHNEFSKILETSDKELYNHITGIAEMKAFLYQWWLSFMSSHVPDLSIVNRIMDFCIIQGWKVGMFKLSLSLLISNKPILMSLDKGDDEVIYQHLLNESKWGILMKDLDLFFGSTLLSWDDSLFVGNENFVKPLEQIKNQKSILNPFKGLSLNLSRHRSNSDTASRNSTLVSQSESSLFSNKPPAELESIYSDVSDSSEGKSLTGFLKLPSILRRRESIISSDYEIMSSKNTNQLLAENIMLKDLLKKAQKIITDNGLEATDLKQELSLVFSS